MIQNQMLSPHFSIKEMTDSQTAVKYGITNVPSEQEIENLRRLCQGTLEPLRMALQLPVVITSGFRTKALNDKVGHSSKRSQHMQGQAADFYVAQKPVSGSKIQVSSTGEAAEPITGFKSEPSRRELLIKAFREILQNPMIDYDQLILYPNFIHVSYVSKEHNRHNILKARSDGKLGYGKLSYTSALLLNY